MARYKIGSDIGVKAKNALEILGAFIDSAEDKALEDLARGETAPEEVRMRYCIILSFEKFAQSIIRKGEKADERINAIKKEIASEINAKGENQ